MNYSWRNHKDHKSETKAVKTALVTEGYPDAKVGHGTGTAWGWLHLKVSVPKPANCFCNDINGGRCSLCQVTWELHYRKVIAIAQRVTGRHGEYQGDINADVNLV